MPLLTIVSLLGHALALVRLLGREVEIALFGALSAIVALLYAAGLAGCLKPAAVLLFHLGLALFVICGYLFHREKKNPLALVTPGVALFVLLGAVFWFLFKDARYFFWDEFSHWGLVTREILAHDALPDGSGAVSFMRYPPAAALWQYFVCVNTGYSEGATYFAQFTMLVAPLTVFFKNLSFRRWHWIGIVAALLCLALLNLGHGVACLYVDHLLSTWFAGIVLAWMSARRPGRGSLLLLPALFVLALVKEVGFFLAVAAGLWILLYALMFQGLLRGLREGDRRRALLDLALVLAVVSSPLLARTSWGWHLEKLGVRTFQAAETRVADFGRVLQGKGTDRQTLILDRFREVALGQQLSKDEVSRRYNEFSYGIRHEYKERWRLSAAGWYLCAMALLAAAFTACASRTDRLRVCCAATCATLVCVTYACMLLYLYLFILESERLQSYIRYCHVVMMPVFLLSAAAFIPAWGISFRRRGLAFGILAAAMILLFVFETPHFRPLYAKNPHHRIRQALEAPIGDIGRIVKPRERVYVVFQVKENGYQRTMIRHDLAPIVSTLSPHDIHLESPEAFARILSGHDYLWCLAAGRELISGNAALFGGRAWKPLRLFRIEKGASGITLMPAG